MVASARVIRRCVLLYEITLTGRYNNQLTISRWNYTSTSTPAGISRSQALLIAFGGAPDLTPSFDWLEGSIMEEMSAMVSDGQFWTEVMVRAVYDPLDFFTNPLPTNARGAKTGTPQSGGLAFKFRTNRVRQDIRRGTKSFAGVTESDTGLYGVIESGTIAQMNSLASKMSAPLTYSDEGNTLIFAPVVVSKEEYTTPSGKKAYRYRDEEEQDDYIASSIVWQAVTETRTQRSRMVGNGR